MIRVCVAWTVVATAFMALGAAASPDPVVRAVFAMALGLSLLWVGVGSGVTFVVRQRVRGLSARFGHRPRIAFVVSATALALVEEAVATTLTNLAPLLAVPVQRAHITASADYFEVVLLHSVVVFVPMFAVWGWLLGRYAFHPATVFLLFGITGLLAETLSFGLPSPLLAGFWVCVYGLMVFLPACAFPRRPDRRRPRLRVALGAVVLPIAAAVPVAVLVMLLHVPQHQLPPPG